MRAAQIVLVLGWILASTQPFPLERSRALLPARSLALRGGDQHAMAPAPSKPDTLSLEELAMDLATMRAQFLQASGLSEEAVCRIILTNRMQDVNLCRCRCGESTIPGAGRGLFATRDIAAGEVITLYPSDAVLLWEDAEHSIESEVQLFFGRHVTQADRDLARVVRQNGAHAPLQPC
jgi:hypothetical protein